MYRAETKIVKVTISLDKPKMTVTIEDKDAEMGNIGDVVEQVFVRFKKVWFDYSKRQTKLPEETK